MAVKYYMYRMGNIHENVSNKGYETQVVTN